MSPSIVPDTEAETAPADTHETGQTDSHAVDFENHPVRLAITITPPIMSMDGGVDLYPKADSDSDTESDSKNSEQAPKDPKQTTAAEAEDNYFTDGAVPRALSPIISEPDSDIHRTISMHKDSDLYIQAKNKNGVDILFEVNSAILAGASPVFRKMIYGTRPRPDTGDWIIKLAGDNAKALRHIFRIIHFQFGTKDAMRARTQGEIGEILMLVHKYELDSIVYPFAKKWSADLTVALQLDQEKQSNDPVQALWIAWKLGDFKNFRELFIDVTFWACTDQNGAIQGLHGDSLEDLPWSKEILEAIETNRLVVIRRILATLSDPIDYFMSPDAKPNGRYCKSIDNQVDCQSALLGSTITSLNKAGLWPLPKPEKYDESVYRLRQIVGSLRITALTYHGRPPHEQRHFRCGLEHKEVLEELKTFTPVLPDALLKDMKHRGQMMLTFDEEAWAPYKEQDKWEDIDMEPEDSIVDDGWDE